MKVRSETGDIVAEFLSITRVDDKLFVDAKLLGSMRMDVVLMPEDVYDGAKLLFSWVVFTYILLMPYFGLRRLFGRSSK